MITPRSARWVMVVQGLLVVAGSIALLRVAPDDYAFRVGASVVFGTAILVLGAGLWFRLRFLRPLALLVEGALAAFYVWGMVDVARYDYFDTRAKLLLILALGVAFVVCVIAMSLLLSAWEPRRRVIISTSSEPVAQWLEGHQSPTEIPPAYYPQNAAVDASGRPVTGPAAALASGPGFAHGAQAERTRSVPTEATAEGAVDDSRHGGPGAWPGTSAAAAPVDATAALRTAPPPRPVPVRRGPGAGSCLAVGVIAVAAIAGSWAAASAATTYRNEPDVAFEREANWACAKPDSLRDPDEVATPAELADYVDERLPYLERADGVFETLVPPPGYVDGYREFVASWARVTEVFQRAAQATTSDADNSAAPLLAAAQGDVVVIDTYSAAHGLDRCEGWLGD